jgi:hypothetical protein
MTSSTLVVMTRIAGGARPTRLGWRLTIRSTRHRLAGIAALFVALYGATGCPAKASVTLTLRLATVHGCPM